MARTVRFENDKYEKIGNRQTRRNNRQVEHILHNLKGVDPTRIKLEDDETELLEDTY